MMVKKKKLKYQAPWSAIRDAYPNLLHADVDSDAVNIFASVKFDNKKHQEKLAELQEEATRGKCKRLQSFWTKPAKKPKTEAKTDSEELANSS